MAKQNKNLSDSNNSNTSEKQPFEPLFVPKDLAKTKIEEAARELNIANHRLYANVRELDRAKAKALEMIKAKEGETRSDDEIKYYKEVGEYIASYPN